MLNQVIFVSATPAEYELQKSEGVVVEQLLRPTGLLEPVIHVKPSLNQIDDLLHEIDNVIKAKERVLVTTLTKKMAEELTKYLAKLDIKCKYIHSEVDTLERVDILRELRAGDIDVLVGVNLLREGLDLPEVSLVAILDADKEGFLRSERALTQTAGRAARNINSKVIMYADKITDSMQRTIDETNRRREKQIKYNIENNITPTQIVKSTDSMMKQSSGGGTGQKESRAYIENESTGIAADPVIMYMSKPQLQKAITQIKSQMQKAVKALDFMEAARLRDNMYEMEALLKDKKD
jgi:excinuclease ABC subunit B